MFSCSVAMRVLSITCKCASTARAQANFQIHNFLGVSGEISSPRCVDGRVPTWLADPLGWSKSISHFQILPAVLRNHIYRLFFLAQVVAHIDVQYFHVVIFSPFSLNTIVYESYTLLDLYYGLSPIPWFFENCKKFSFFRAFVGSKF